MTFLEFEVRPVEQLVDPLYWPGGSTVVGRGFRSMIASSLFLWLML